MSEMVERVARALQDMLVDTKGEPLQPLSKVMASAAIAAMREPTEAMLNAGMEEAAVDLASEWRAMIDEALK